jgi:hypothetical protein
MHLCDIRQRKIGKGEVADVCTSKKPGDETAQFDGEQSLYSSISTVNDL